MSKLDRESKIYYPNVIYRYTVAGREFTDGNFAFAKGDGVTKQWSATFVEQRPMGTELLVHVNPEDHSESVIEPGVHWSAYRNAVLMILLCLAVGSYYQWQSVS